MKKIIVNADDFGQTDGVNEGIIKAHSEGIVTSASLMVNGDSAESAVSLAEEYPGLGLGLHFQLTKDEMKVLQQLKKAVAIARIEKTKKEFTRQFNKFRKLTGKLPDHIDGHHHIHRLPQIYPFIRNFVKPHKIPLRDDVNFITKFYGSPDKTNVSKSRLIEIIEDIPRGISELMCHPAISTKNLTSSYFDERLLELESLTSDKIKDVIKESDIKLVNWSEV